MELEEKNQGASSHTHTHTQASSQTDTHRESIISSIHARRIFSRFTGHYISGVGHWAVRDFPSVHFTTFTSAAAGPLS